MRRSPPDEGARIVPILFRSLHLLLENRAARSPNRRWRANQAAELCPCCTGPAKRRSVVNGVHRRYRDVDRVSVGDYNQGMADARYGWLDTQFHLNTLPRAQLFLWPALAEFKLDFVLYGGTAIALRLAHRESVDFDFFSTRHFQPGELRARSAPTRYRNPAGVTRHAGGTETRRIRRCETLIFWRPRSGARAAAGREPG